MKLCRLAYCWASRRLSPQYRRHVRLGHRPSKGAGFFSYVEIEVSLFGYSLRLRLTTQTQSSDDFVVLLDVRLLQVIEQTSAMRDHLQQAAPRMIVLLVCLEMLGEFVNALTQERDLHLG